MARRLPLAGLALGGLACLCGHADPGGPSTAPETEVLAPSAAEPDLSFGLVALSATEALLDWSDGKHQGRLKMSRPDFERLFGPLRLPALTPAQQRSTAMQNATQPHSISGEVMPGADYSDEERVFLQAIERYKRERDRPFPTWSEVLAILHALGYRPVADPQPLPAPPLDGRCHRPKRHL